MNQVELQGKRIEALKVFNSTLVTNRLYPPDAPQVATAVDRGYKGLKLYLRQHGDLTFALLGDMFLLCDLPLSQETLDLYPNLIVYRQLRLLGLSRLIIGPDMDRFAFAQLLSVFSASVGKIKKEGGGLEYITSLGLSSYFEGEIDTNDSGGDEKGVQASSRKQVKVRAELVACLFGRDKRPVIEAELSRKMADPESAIEILAAGVGYVLQDIRKKKMIIASPSFPMMLIKGGELLGSKNQHEVALGLARVLTQSLKDLALCVLIAQDYAGGIGRDLYQCLIGLLSKEQLARIMVVFREQIAKEEKARGTNSPQVQFLGKVLHRLMKSEKGKQFLSSEKARTMIHEGEKERKKRRLEAGVRGYLQGDRTRLRSAELVEYLPEAVRQLGQKRDQNDVSLLLREIVASCKDATDQKEMLLACIITIGENLLADSSWGQLDILVDALKEEVRNGDLFDTQIEKIVIYLQEVMQKCWQEREMSRGDEILTFFYHIRSGKIPQPVSIKNIVGKVQDRGIRRAHLPPLLGQCLASPKDQILSSRLIQQGPVALRFLVESLIHTDDAADRLKIIDLLTENPDFLPAVVLERLQEHMAWHGKRNLIKLLGETGGEDDAEALLPYLRHDDLRVQGETFLTLYKIGGRNRKRLLLRALEASSELLKLQIIGALENFCDAEVAVKLVDLLASHEDLGEKNRNAILLKVVETLGKCPCPQAHKGVQSFLRTKGQKSTKTISDQVWQAAEKAVKFLHSELQETRKKHVQASQLRKNALIQAAKLGKGTPGDMGITGSIQEQEARELLARRDKAGASKKVLDLIEKTARHGNFVQAEKLRKWLGEFNPEALSLLLKAGELLDREKNSTIDKSHLDIWADLYDVLTSAEFSAMYHGLQHHSFEDEEVIVDQGELRGKLFFINSGMVKISFDDGSSDTLIKTMGQGNIFGAEAYFEASVWTFSAAAIGRCEILSLDLDSLEEWAESFPDLESKLQKYCEKFQITDVFLQENNRDRRKYQRFSIVGRLATTLLDNRGRGVGSEFTVKLLDVSQGGLSFLLRISKKEKSRLLLGRKMQIPFPAHNETGQGIDLIGEIVAVKKTFTKENNYSLHMKFDQLLTLEQVDEIVSTMQLNSRAGS